MKGEHMATLVEHAAQIHHVQIIVVPQSALDTLSLPGPGGELTQELLDLATKYVNTNAPSAMADSNTIVGIGAKVAIPKEGKLVDHDSTEHQPIRMWTESDIIQWECDRPFVILSVDKFTRSGYQSPGSPDTPFYLRPPYASDSSHVARSSIAMGAANNQHYKARIRVGGNTLDPDIICGFPPP
jgi:hypothetical protein